MVVEDGNAASSSGSIHVQRRLSDNLTRRSSRTLRQTVSGQPVPPKDTTTALLISGAAAGGVSKLLTAPVDRVKIMYQVSTSRPFTITAGMRTAAEIVKTAGFTALWRGNSIAVVRDVPYAAIMFSVRQPPPALCALLCHRRAHCHAGRLCRRASADASCRSLWPP